MFFFPQNVPFDPATVLDLVNTTIVVTCPQPLNEVTPCRLVNHRHHLRFVALVLWSWRTLERDVGLDVRSYGRSRIAIQVIPKNLRDIHPPRLADEFRGVSAGEADFTI